MRMTIIQCIINIYLPLFHFSHYLIIIILFIRLSSTTLSALSEFLAEKQEQEKQQQKLNELRQKVLSLSSDILNDKGEVIGEEIGDKDKDKDGNENGKVTDDAGGEKDL